MIWTWRTVSKLVKYLVLFHNIIAAAHTVRSQWKFGYTTKAAIYLLTQLNIIMHILRTVLYTFPRVMIGRIRLTIMRMSE